MRREHLFVLRIWSDRDDGTAWRASLENLRTKEKRHFESLEALQVFLCSPPEPREREAPSE